MKLPFSGTCFQGFFLPDDYSLDFKTLQQQQSQDPVLRTVYSLLTRNENPESLTPLITATPFLHAYHKRFAQLFIENSTNLFRLYTTSTNSPATYLFSKYYTRYYQNLSSFSNV